MVSPSSARRASRVRPLPHARLPIELTSRLLGIGGLFVYFSSGRRLRRGHRGREANTEAPATRIRPLSGERLRDRADRRFRMPLKLGGSREADPPPPVGAIANSGAGVGKLGERHPLIPGSRRVDVGPGDSGPGSRRQRAGRRGHGPGRGRRWPGRCRRSRAGDPPGSVATGRATGAPDRVRDLAGRLAAASNPVLRRRPRRRRVGSLGSGGATRRASTPARLRPSPRPAAAGSASPRATPTSRASCHRRSARSRRRSPVTDLILVAAPRCSPTTPMSPATSCPRGPTSS